MVQIQTNITDLLSNIQVNVTHFNMCRNLQLISVFLWIVVALPLVYLLGFLLKKWTLLGLVCDKNPNTLAMQIQSNTSCYSS